jgi:hypothetical protein
MAPPAGWEPLGELLQEIHQLGVRTTGLYLV